MSIYFMSQGEFPAEMFTQFRQLEHEYIGYQSLTDVPRTLTYREELMSYETYRYNKYTYMSIYFMSQGEFPEEMFTQFRQLEDEYIG
ncbi:putative phosphorylase b kinase regulatory subunit beta [Operophtera brumata]|uniref:Putative phosphorylase b kinase regulatory subunit beta n=1 Tax=Operophtera brumata TaxID=104452 RepID=A0A0L7L4B2_OPEBR|nr:putative phosphorylase b kinase regulatory subunit beta [Operophtera brumata]